MARVTRAMAMTTKRANAARGMVTATKRAMVMAVRAMATATKRMRITAAKGIIMAMKRVRARAARRMAMATNRARVRAARGMATVTRVVGNKEGEGEGKGGATLRLQEVWDRDDDVEGRGVHVQNDKKSELWQQLWQQPV
jgi:hypothetical protein